MLVATSGSEKRTVYTLYRTYQTTAVFSLSDQTLGV